jgi:two-component system response regulator YesN
LLQLSPQLHMCHQGGQAPYSDLQELQNRLGRNWDVVGIAASDRSTKQEAEAHIREGLEHYLFYSSGPLSSPIALNELEELRKTGEDSGIEAQLQADWRQFKWLLYGKEWSAWNERVASLRPVPSFVIGLVEELHHNWMLYMEWSPEELARIKAAGLKPREWAELEHTQSEMALVVQRRLADLSLSREVVLCLVRALQDMKRQACKSLTQTDIARGVNMSRSYFSQCFKLFVGNSFGEVLRKMRIDQAKHWLLESSMSISEISVAIGFDDNKHFSRIFRERVGMYPTEYRVFHQSIEVNAE